MTERTDPFEALREPVAPVRPDPAFAARLRSRLEHALLDPGGATMTTATQTTATQTTATQAIIPYLAVRDARRALEWYADVFGAEVRGEPIVMPDGRIGHSVLALAGNTLYMADAHPEMGVVAPSAEGASVSLLLPVDDLDATLARVRGAGGRVTREPYEGYGQRNATVVDPFGHRWMLQAPLPAATEADGYRPGDVAYTSLNVPDVGRAADFYEAVLGWRYAGPERRHVVGVHPSQGLWGAQRSTAFLCFAVADVDAAVRRVRELGGRADEPSQEPHGYVADCVDDQGVAFALYQAPGTGAEDWPAARHGELAYLVMEVTDSARARAFYGELLGWRFTPGRVEDGWNIEGVRPPAGLNGGHERPTVVPMYAVDDVAAAVERVRAAGGTATEPQRQPYGISAECTDDQGTRFWLGQLD